MPITLVVDHERRWTQVKAEGLITLAEIKKHLEEEQRERGFAYPELIDACSATVSLSVTEIHELTDTLRDLAKQWPFGPTAVVVSSDVNYGILRMLGTILSDVIQIRPFRNRQQAEVWLAQPQTNI
ncbi:MAG TPA: hypothetical protein VFA71_04605 [Terriglobales bacterium]|nr:hypothetical protein [Terriglobales bacterium]